MLILHVHNIVCVLLQRVGSRNREVWYILVGEKYFFFGEFFGCLSFPVCYVIGKVYWSGVRVMLC